MEKEERKNKRRVWHILGGQALIFEYLIIEIRYLVRLEYLFIVKIISKLKYGKIHLIFVLFMEKNRGTTKTEKKG